MPTPASDSKLSNPPGAAHTVQPDTVNTDHGLHTPRPPRDEDPYAVPAPPAAPGLCCPNCGEAVEDATAGDCVLHALFGVIHDRGNSGISTADIYDLHAKCDIDAVWNTLGPIIDSLEAGEFSDD